MFTFWYPPFNQSDLVILFDRREVRKCLVQQAKHGGATRAERFYKFVAPPLIADRTWWVFIDEHIMGYRGRVGPTE